MTLGEFNANGSIEAQLLEKANNICEKWKGKLGRMVERWKNNIKIELKHRTLGSF